jgi:hypothetical protein
MNARGDTIVEVLFAVTVFSLVAVGGLSLMNQGTAMAQRSLEIGLVRDQMDAQADALRYMHNAYIANIGEAAESTATKTWKDASANHMTSRAQAFGDMSDGRECKLPTPSGSGGSDGAPYVLDTRKLDGTDGDPTIVLQADDVKNTATYSKVHYFEDDDYKKPPLNPAKPEGIWVQAVHFPITNDTPGYYDFHIRACWLAPGQSSPVTLGTIVRLYDPKV